MGTEADAAGHNEGVWVEVRMDLAVGDVGGKDGGCGCERDRGAGYVPKRGKGIGQHFDILRG
jgi:hypothetical protein